MHASEMLPRQGVRVLSWRPNLADEGDNHIVVLAVAGGAEAIVTNSVRDFLTPQLMFPGLRAVRPRALKKELP
jgi:hypothetical protein